MRSLERLIDPALVARCQHIRHLTARLWESLPPEFLGNCMVIGSDDGIISIVGENAAWATRLRFFEPQILEVFHKAGTPCSRLRVSVRPLPADPLAQRPPPPSRPSPPAPESVKALRQLAEDEAHPELSAALQRLARRFDPRV